MMDQDRITQYIHSLDQGHGAFCDQIAKTARTGRVPIIRKETANFLQAMVAAKQPKRILEVGTAVGYSALLMAQVMPEGTNIITIEKYEPRIPVARRHFEEAGLSDRITLLEGDAGEILKELDGSFDFIFMDAAKGQYIHWLPDILRLLSTGGVLFSDNVLQDGDIIESRFAVERRENEGVSVHPDPYAGVSDQRGADRRWRGAECETVKN